MNDENTNEDREVTPDAELEEVASALMAEQQDQIDCLGQALEVASDRVRELEAEARESTAAVATAPAGDAELRSLAATARQAQRNGHPDAGKHVDALLNALGAA
jgi:hypothetical protein